MIDDIDGKILSILQNDARTSNAEIARRLAMAPSAILERIRKLETRGLIEGYEARLNPKALEMGLLAFIYVRADERIGSRVIGDELAMIPEVQEVHHIAGEDCYLLKVRVADTNALSDLLRQRLGPIDAIRSTRTTIVLSTIKETAQIPLPSTEKEALSDAG
jgi:Lrp/AsnC family transcriptional regulator, leucine-responsive regulatory protein